MAEIKVIKIDEQGEQTVFIYVNEYTKTENLTNCILFDYFKMTNFYTKSYKNKSQEIKNSIRESKHFLIWNAKYKNISFCVRK